VFANQLLQTCISGVELVKRVPDRLADLGGPMENSYVRCPQCLGERILSDHRNTVEQARLRSNRKYSPLATPEPDLAIAESADGARARFVIVLILSVSKRITSDGHYSSDKAASD
jgi:hypothetical protein